MRSKALLVVALVLPLVLAGCIDQGTSALNESDEPLGPSDQAGNVSSTNETEPEANESREPAQEPSASEPDENETEAPPEREPPEEAPPSEDPGWPSLNEASIRPGVQVIAGGSQCTSNFLFRTPSNSTLLLGLAAHCVSDIDIGDPVRIPAANANGTLVYSGWKVDGQENEESGLDFSLVAIHADHRGKVHPAVRHFGGPTGLASPEQVDTFTKVLWYGNSGAHGFVEETNRHEGYVLWKDGKATFDAYSAAPGVPGDSGSGVMDGDGRAAGVLVTVNISPDPGANGMVFLHTALEQAKDRGIHVDLVTWPLLEQGMLP
ncbi:MAG: hypothetical protein R3185_04495 [Candidatus Thermoplasmatota archaeon]|nr:hypothetical protein [Candidatus Thermoplasmatota archaeon]